jgi:hypothetical protein
LTRLDQSGCDVGERLYYLEWSLRTSRGMSSPRRGLLSAVLLSLGCGHDSTELARHRERWESRRPAHYAFLYTVTGFASGGGPWRIEVSNTTVFSSAYAGAGAEPSPVVTTEHAPTIEALFDAVGRGIKTGACTRVNYDEAFGFPADAYFDAGEEGDGFTARDLVVVTH